MWNCAASTSEWTGATGGPGGRETDVRVGPQAVRLARGPEPFSPGVRGSLVCTTRQGVTPHSRDARWAEHWARGASLAGGSACQAVSARSEQRQRSEAQRRCARRCSGGVYVRRRPRMGTNCAPGGLNPGPQRRQGAQERAGGAYACLRRHTCGKQRIGQAGCASATFRESAGQRGLRARGAVAYSGKQALTAGAGCVASNRDAGGHAPPGSCKSSREQRGGPGGRAAFVSQVLMSGETRLGGRWRCARLYRLVRAWPLESMLVGGVLGRGPRGEDAPGPGKL